MKEVQQGDTVKVHYKAIFKDEVLFDSSTQLEPMQITLGKDEIIPSFEKALLGMQIGENKSIFVQAKDAFGPYLKELVSTVNKKELPPSLELEIGQLLQVKQPDGSTVLVTITDIKKEAVTFDANHPLAGKDLTFDINLIEIV